VKTYLAEMRTLLTGEAVETPEWAAPSQLFANPKAACAVRR